nr:MAG: chromate transporter [Hyphomicrobiales bacterium]
MPQPAVAQPGRLAIKRGATIASTGLACLYQWPGGRANSCTADGPRCDPMRYILLAPAGLFQARRLAVSALQTARFRVMTDDTPPKKLGISLPSMLVLFLHIGLTSFGGSTMAWMHREIVEKRKLLSDQGFMTGLTIAQVLPGANPVNLALYLGMHARGRMGAAVAVFGIIFPAFCVILIMGFLYRTYSGFETTHVVLGGVAAAGVGATLAMGVKLARSVMVRFVPTAIALFTFFVVGILRWPLVPVVAVMVPLSILQAYLMHRRQSKDG